MRARNRARPIRGIHDFLTLIEEAGQSASAPVRSPDETGVA